MRVHFNFFNNKDFKQRKNIYSFLDLFLYEKISPVRFIFDYINFGYSA